MTVVNIFPLTEPIITEGSPEFKVLEDAWTAVSLDNQRCLLSARLRLNCAGREGWSDGDDAGAGELLLLAPPALARALTAALRVSGPPSSSTQFSSRRGARRS